MLELSSRHEISTHKNPCQHYADINMIDHKEELKPAFCNVDTGNSKAIDCIRVNGASDEGPGHDEVVSTAYFKE